MAGNQPTPVYADGLRHTSYSRATAPSHPRPVTQAGQASVPAPSQPPPVTLVGQASGVKADDQGWWKIRKITQRGARLGQVYYKVVWIGTDSEGKPWKDSWAHEDNVADDIKTEFETDNPRVAAFWTNSFQERSTIQPSADQASSDNPSTDNDGVGTTTDDKTITDTKGPDDSEPAKDTDMESDGSDSDEDAPWEYDDPMVVEDADMPNHDMEQTQDDDTANQDTEQNKATDMADQDVNHINDSDLEDEDMEHRDYAKSDDKADDDTDSEYEDGGNVQVPVNTERRKSKRQQRQEPENGGL